MNAFKLVPKTFVTYLMHVEDHYRHENPYHNSMHAADVVQSSHVLLSVPFLEVRLIIIRLEFCKPNWNVLYCESICLSNTERL